ncbi:hypothetical protein RBH29_14645 [Herbivorax sp. ANBcel31]|uniref:hypothetical protein n=1 Tax=Herbivorax sp. ANBcel31 TaxID=3069754 RepID=UPI0027AE11D4|nr:hypothetical protein [Herbivorax sp. ANBcel31]MDQ2087666.1 hypothetical protein [Herbivorax sp. ANBcel31]
MLSNETMKFSDREIVEKGSKALIKELGYAGFLRFIRQIESSGKEDYLSIQEDIYKDMSLDDVFEKASNTWSNIK